MTSLHVRQTAWAMPCLVAAAVAAGLLLLFEAVVLLQAARARARHAARHRLLLGQSLLLGLLATCCGAATLSLQPAAATCSATRLLVAMGTTLIYASLLVKCVLLHSQHSGVYLPTGYQLLLLVTLTGVQLALELHSLATSCRRHCHSGLQDQAVTLLYPLLLLAAATVAALRWRHVRENGRESVFIGVTGVLSTVLWCSWAAVDLLASPLYEMSLSVTLTLNTLVVFLVMFVSKSRQLISIGRRHHHHHHHHQQQQQHQHQQQRRRWRHSGYHGNAVVVADEDRDDSFCYGDTAPYSPSFYHFRPVKMPPTDVWRKHPLLHPAHIATPYVIPRCSGYIRQEDNVYSSLEQHKRPSGPEHTHSTNPNVFFYRSPYSPGMLY